MTKHRLALTGLLLLGAAPTLAQPPGYDAPPTGAGEPEGDRPPRREPRPLTRERAQTTVERGFALLDVNHDRVVTRDEFDAFRQARREAMGARGGEEGPGGPPPPPPGYAEGNALPPPAGGPEGPGGAPHGLGPMMGGNWFAMADLDHDGRITLAEARSAAMAMFDRMDLNHDGVVTPEERHAAMHGSMRGPGDDMPPPR